MTSEFENYVPIQGLIEGVEEITKAEETMSESSEIVSPLPITQNISESVKVTIT